ncbi:unnamed protein product [Moneuplotes crassus]|uniref:Uncharacterized protein n=1 Tax=Euplotes crassus TaxID=5936 RepID=A0AAD1XPY3_EUPCR|nr:unnamed protein product [Moneuplotes crassus]
MKDILPFSLSSLHRKCKQVLANALNQALTFQVDHYFSYYEQGASEIISN